MLLLYLLWDDWTIFMISGSNEQLQQQLKYTLLKPDFHSWWISKMQSGREDTLEERYAIKLFFKLGKNVTETYGKLQTAFGVSCMNRASAFEWHKGFKDGRESVRDGEKCGRVKEVNTPELISQRIRVRVTMISFLCLMAYQLFLWGYYVEVLREFSQRFKSGQWHFYLDMHQSSTPSLSQTIWPRWASRQFYTLPIVQTLLLETIGYSLSSEAVVMRQLRRWKQLCRRSLTRSYKRTSMEPSKSCWDGTTSALQPDDITSKGTSVSRVYYQ